MQGMMPAKAPVNDDAKWEALGAILEQMRAALEAAEERLTKLESTVMDELIGGITKLYDENTRFENVGKLKEKYSDLFGEHESAFKDLYDVDLWEKLQDLIDELRGEEGYTDEVGDDKIKEIADQLKSKVAKLRGEEVAVEGEPGETEVAIEVKEGGGGEGPEESSEESSEEDAIKPLVDTIKRMKAGGRVPGVMGEPRDEE